MPLKTTRGTGRKVKGRERGKERGEGEGEGGEL